nr:unnamed protein product [Spirometra erinaceieuropaei]
MWRQGEVPQDFKDVAIAHLYKRKGNYQISDNHRSLSLLSIAEKIFARILPSRLNNHMEQSLPTKNQCGFRRHSGAMYMIFAARQLQEMCQDMRTHLNSTFVDLTKAFDTANCGGLVLNSTSEEDMQRSTDLFSAACDNFGLVINTEKTAVIHQPPPDAAFKSYQISVDGTQLQVVDTLTYLSSTLTGSTKIDDEVARRTSRASHTFGRLQSIVWNHNGFYFNTKTEDVQGRQPTDVVVWSRDLDGLKEAGTQTQPLIPQLFRRILKLRWQDRVPDTDVLEWT